MALRLNNFFLLLVLMLSSESFFTQNGVETPVYKDYKDPDQFEKFRKRSIIVAAWQINTLKDEGAIVVKLKTNKILIDELIKRGNTDLALEKQLEQFAINKNTLFAYKEHLNFCKVYFIYSQSSDTLMNGARKGFFLDTNLNVDPSIEMLEKFYIVAERDMAVSSSIGFIEEDSARIVKERGNPIKSMAIVLKNKYGHQLKDPFPYSIKEKSFTDVGYNFPIKFSTAPAGGISITYIINRTYLQDLKKKPEPQKITKKENDATQTAIKLKKEFTYERLSGYVEQLNDDLNQMYKTYPKPDVNRIQPEIKLFLY